MSLPRGDVVLDDSGRPVVFANAGIGITPIAGMLSHLVAAGSGLMNLADVILPGTAWYYLCGPIAFMQAVRSALSNGVSRPPTSSTRCSAPTSDRPTSTERS